jgi:malonyl-CoA decarboxylase
LLLGEQSKSMPTQEPSTAVFYSISNCQEGLRGISFGNFLIKQVVEDLVKERPSLKTFVTLSPVPDFADWLAEALSEDTSAFINYAERAQLAALVDNNWLLTNGVDNLKPLLLRLAAHYFLRAKLDNGRPVDPVARFHLGNGARLERINWLGDTSAKGLREAHGIMCNYRYDLREIEKNHEAYENEAAVTASRQVQALLKAERGKPDGSKLLAIPRLRTGRPTPASEDGQ